MSSSLSLSLTKSISFVTGGDFKNAFADAASGPWKTAGFGLQREEQRATPVRYGTLQGGWTTGEPYWEGNSFLVQVANVVRYGQAVNVRGKSAGYIEAGIDAARDVVLANLEAGIRAVQLWKQR